MKEKILKILKSKFFLSLVLNLSIFIFCVSITSFSYDNYEDFYNALNICQYHNYYNDDINYILATLIGSVQYVLPNFNCYVLFLVMLSAFSFTTITYVFTDKFGKRKGILFSLIINILFSVNHYADIQSTKTAALLYASGFLLVLNAIRNKRYKLPCWIGVLEIIFGSFLCVEYFPAALLFAIAFFFAEMIAKRKYKVKPRKFFWFFRPYFLMFAFVTALVIGGVNYSYSVNHSSQEASDYYEYSRLTDSIDLLSYPDYDKHKDEFLNLGLSKNDFEMLKSGYYDSNTSLNIDALNLVNNIQKAESGRHFLSGFSEIGLDIFNHFAKFDCTAVICLSFAIISVIFLIIQKKKFDFFPIFFIISAVVLSVFLRYFLGGFAYITYGIYVFLITFMLYAFNFDECKKSCYTYYAKSYKTVIFSSVMSVLLLFSVFSTIYQSNISEQPAKKRPGALYTEVNRHPETLYLLDPETEKEFIKFTNNYTHPLWGFKKSFLANVESFDYPLNANKLIKYNLPTNIYEAAIYDRKIYVIDNGITLRKQKYFNEHYAADGAKIFYKDYKEISGFKIYKTVST